jgi:hypothetical protein
MRLKLKLFIIKFVVDYYGVWMVFVVLLIAFE